MVYIVREGVVYNAPMGVKGNRPIGFCPCCGEYSLFFVSSDAVWCLVCSGLKSSYSLSEDELDAYRVRALLLRENEEMALEEGR